MQHHPGELQIVIYLELMDVCGRENARMVFLWLATIIKMSVIASYIVEKCRTSIFVSVFCGTKKSTAFSCERVVALWQCCVPPSSLKYLILPLLGSKKCLKTMFRTFILHCQSCAYFLCYKWDTYQLIQCFSRKLYIYLIFFIFPLFHRNQWFQAYLPANYYFEVFLNI